MKATGIVRRVEARVIKTPIIYSKSGVNFTSLLLRFLFIIFNNLG